MVTLFSEVWAVWEVSVSLEEVSHGEEGFFTAQPCRQSFSIPEAVPKSPLRDLMLIIDA